MNSQPWTTCSRRRRYVPRTAGVGQCWNLEAHKSIHSFRSQLRKFLPEREILGLTRENPHRQDLLPTKSEKGPNALNLAELVTVLLIEGVFTGYDLQTIDAFKHAEMQKMLGREETTSLQTWTVNFLKDVFQSAIQARAFISLESL